jgi:hypothetical protein
MEKDKRKNNTVAILITIIVVTISICATMIISKVIDNKNETKAVKSNETEEKKEKPKIEKEEIVYPEDLDEKTKVFAKYLVIGSNQSQNQVPGSYTEERIFAVIAEYLRKEYAFKPNNSKVNITNEEVNELLTLANYKTTFDLTKHATMQETFVKSIVATNVGYEFTYVPGGGISIKVEEVSTERNGDVLTKQYTSTCGLDSDPSKTVTYGEFTLTFKYDKTKGKYVSENFIGNIKNSNCYYA